MEDNKVENTFLQSQLPQRMCFALKGKGMDGIAELRKNLCGY